MSTPNFMLLDQGWFDSSNNVPVSLSQDILTNISDQSMIPFIQNIFNLYYNKTDNNGINGYSQLSLPLTNNQLMYASSILTQLTTICEKNNCELSIDQIDECIDYNIPDQHMIISTPIFNLDDHYKLIGDNIITSESERLCNLLKTFIIIHQELQKIEKRNM